MTLRAVLLDLDDTLVPDEAAARAAFRETCRRAAVGRLLDPARLHRAIRRAARRRWRTSPGASCGRRFGMSSWEGLWGRFGEALDEEHARLRAWAPVYRRRAWEDALRAEGVRDPVLAVDLVHTFARERRRRLRPFPDVLPLLDELRGRFALAVVTNGEPRMQREKLACAGLSDLLPVVVVSGEVGARKPDPRPFAVALERLGARPGEAVMVGNSLRSDVGGARAAGIRAIWLDRRGGSDPGEPAPDGRIASLDELAEALERMAEAS